ncbi:MAG: hypothetical protein KDJ36_08855 [Hyphomicrobiaceae bacterium]|nr:hypothetical protein [Hyphomicrobiaceae bacterium]
MMNFNFRCGCSTSVLAAGAGLLMASAGLSPAHSQQVSDLIGSFSGRGTIVFSGNKRERIKCNAYNTGGGEEFRLVIRCASTSYKIEIRSKLSRSGSQLSGTWEERTYNAEGQASGRISAGNVSLNVSGGGFTGRMTVSYSRGSQHVRISTKGIEMRSVEINMSRTG